MSDATYVSFVPKAKREKLRAVLTEEDTGQISWREHRGMFGSEFYFSGPPALVRKTHLFVAEWLTRRS
jgi:hypothetical protein